MGRPTPRSVFSKLAERAWVRGHMTGCPHKKRYEMHIRKVRAGRADPESLAEDLLAGRASPNEIFPIITDWLEERSRA